MFSIKSKLLLWILPLTLLALGALGYVNYLQTAEIITRSTMDSLQTIARTKESALVEYIKGTEKLGASLAATEVVQSYIGLTNRKLSGNNLQTVEGMRERVQNLLHSTQDAHWGRYHHIFMINRSNRVVVSPAHGLAGQQSSSPLLDRDFSSNPWAMGTMQKGRPAISGYGNSTTRDRGSQFFFYPVRDQGNRIQAVIGFELQVPYQQQVVTDGFGLGTSGRIYLMSEKGRPLEQKGLEAPPALTGDPLNQVGLSGNWAGLRLNAAGREVFGHYTKHPDYPWILAVEIERYDVFSGFFRLQFILALGLCGLFLALLVLCIVYANSIGKPLRELVSYIERISRGEFTIDILDPKRKDEVGKLTIALQQLVFSLQMVSKKLRQAKALKKATYKKAS